MQRITKNAWFGKKLIGWGWSPKSWQGWLITLLFIFLIILDFNYFGETPTGSVLLVIIILLFILTAFLTGDKPGSQLFDKSDKTNL